MLFSLGDIVESWKALAKTLSFRRDNGPIDDLAGIEHFVATRAAFVAQKTLYGYLKTRIGTRYPRVFDDPTFVRSINIAKYHVFAACLSDLAIYAVATALCSQEITDESRCDLAMRFFRRGLDDNSDDVPIEFRFDQAISTFADRLKITDWASDALRPGNFRESPCALLKWAPIADHLKNDDSEIVRNSIRFAWRDIREQFQRRLVQVAVQADCKRQTERPPDVQGD